MSIRRLHDDERGGMFAEAVIVLPAFILVWSLIIFVRDGYENAADASVSVRREAWTHSLAFCDGSVSDGVNVDSGRLWSGLTSTAATLLRSGTLDIVRYQPWILTEIPTLVIPPGLNNYSKAGTVSRASALGGSANYGHQLAVACDEEPSSHSMSLWIGTAYLASAPFIL